MKKTILEANTLAFWHASWRLRHPTAVPKMTLQTCILYVNTQKDYCPYPLLRTANEKLAAWHQEQPV